jgi:DNA primase
MSVVIDTISKSVKITDYLTSKNVTCHSHDGDRYKYRCPLPTHPGDNTPSFFVYDKPEGQDYYCYGCKSAGGIIQLVSGIEQISIRDAIRKLSAGLNINVDDIIEAVIREIMVYSESGNKEDKNENIIASSLFISSHMYDFLRRVDFNKADLEMAEKVFEIVDSLVLTDRLTELDKLSNLLPRKTKFRFDAYMESKKKEEIEKLKEDKAHEIRIAQ